MNAISASTREYPCPVCHVVFKLGILTEAEPKRFRRPVTIRVWVDGVAEVVAHVKEHG